MAKHKKKAPLPKPLDVGEIDPTPLDTPSEKIQEHPEEKKKKQTWVDKVSWFGD